MRSFGANVVIKLIEVFRQDYPRLEELYRKVREQEQPGK